MGLKTRKQIRQDYELAATELAFLKTPEGLAQYLVSKGGDEEFEAAFQAEVTKLDEDAPHGEPEEQEPESTYYRFGLVQVLEDGTRLPVYAQDTPFSEEAIVALAAAHNIDRAALQVDEHAP
jgi:hypothetical protein